MKSALPKVLHPLCGRPMLAYVLDAWASTDAGATGARRSSSTRRRSRPCARSSPTGPTSRSRTSRAAPATPCGPPSAVPDGATEILVLSGDVPLVTGADLEAILEARREDDAAIALASVFAADPAELGRVVRSEFGTVERIVEAKDATPRRAGRQRDQRRAVRLRCRLAAPSDRRPGAVGRDRRAVPDRPRPARPRGRPDRERGRLRGRRPLRRHQRPLPARRRRVEPAGPAQRGAHARRGHDARPLDGLPRLDVELARGRHPRAERHPARRDDASGRAASSARAASSSTRRSARRQRLGEHRRVVGRRGRARPSGRSATCGRAASSAAAPRSATSPSSRTPTWARARSSTT